MVGAIPAGLTMNLLVQFESNILGDFHDQLKIMTDDDKTYVIPLHSYESACDFIFPEFINFGFVQKGRDVSQFITIKNKGKKAGKMELKINNIKNIQIVPAVI